MVDVFREVDEEVRRDQLASIWSKYSIVIIGAAVLLVGSVAGWRYYEHQRLKTAEAAGASLDAAIRQLREPDTSAEGETALATIGKGDARGYAIIARFRAASALAKSDATAAAASFDALSSDTTLDETLRSLARLRAAMLRVDSQPYADVKAALEPLTAATAPWRNTARELLGASALKAGQMDEAGRWFDQLVTDPETPAALRQRGDLYLGLVRSGPVPAAK
ncbi:MAG: tetratricopeptide repeat protein [Bosea sp. (in: a-proteobacteria)]